MIIAIIIVLIIFIICIYYNNIEQFDNINNEYILSKNIYTYWDKPDNDIINAHIETWKRNIPKDWTINFITKDNVSEYVSKEFLNKYKKLDSVRFSDFLRVELLSKNGGVWMDSGIIVINGNFLNKYYEEMIANHYDITLYTLKKNATIAPYLENWFLMAPKNSKYITDLYKEFDRAYSMGFYLYMIMILIPSGVRLDNTLRYVSTYLMQHAIINYLLHCGNKYKINIKDSEFSMFQIQHQMKWDNVKIINFILDNEDWTNYDAIKLTGWTRKYINYKNKDRYIKKLNKL
jgi:hypothetical protein